jgi:tetratricopeptide (TPR) repeat protein
MHAYQAFREARTRQDDFYEAYLYEGIALDLLSKHDEAIKRFEYLENEKRMTDRALREKAIYNQAISLLRKYQYSSTRRAEAVLERLINEIDADPEVSQIKAMALATKASVIAQYPMYWTVLAPGSKDSPISELEYRTKSEDAGNQWIGEVAKLRTRLQRILEIVEGEDKWDRGAERQLEWAINNAWGSVHLNSAIYVYSTPDSKPGPPEWQQKRLEYLDEAYEAFQNCAMLLTPGVENLTNLAKVTLELGRFAQGCAYLEEVRKMNPSYEYAYFRLAKEWHDRKQPARVVKILRSFQGTPTISSFAVLFEQYKDQLNPPKV